MHRRIDAAFGRHPPEWANRSIRGIMNRSLWFWPESIRNRPIATRLLFSILLVSFFFTLGTTVLQLYLDYRTDMGVIDQRLKQIEDSYLKSLAKGTWDLDEQSLRLQLEGILQLQDIRYLEIWTEFGQLLSKAGVPGSQMVQNHQFPLKYQYRDRIHSVGTLEVVVTLEGVFARLRKKLLLILGTQAVKIFCMSAFILMIFQTLVTRHLATMADYARQFSLDRLDQPLRLKRRVKNGPAGDEIDAVVNAFNEMRVNLIQDINRRLQAEEQLKKSEQRYRLLINAMNDGLIVIDTGGIITFVNPKICNLLGREASALVGAELSSLFDDANREILKTELRKRKEGGNLPYELAFNRSDGSQFPTLVSPQGLTDEKGIFIGSMAVVTDITQQKRSEEELRRIRNFLDNIVNSMPSALVCVDLENRVMLWNKECERITGCSVASAHGRYLTEVLPQLNRQLERIQAAVLQKQRQPAQKVSWPTAEGPRYFNILIYPLIANGLEGAVIRLDDITETVRMEEIMIQTEKMISVGGLTAGVAHELNNPLGAILNGAQNVIRRLSPGLGKNQEAAAECGIDLQKMQAYLDRRQILLFLNGIKEAGERANRIMSNMLQFARKSDSEKKPCQLTSLMERAIELANNDYSLKKDFDFRHIEIVRDYETDMPVVPAVATEIEQVFLNLLRNAAQAMAERKNSLPPRIILRLGQEKTMARIVIEDNGGGMDETTRLRVFDPFFTTKPVGRGTGLGLSVSYMIITHNHQGSMEVESIPGKGTRFLIRLPLMSIESGEAV